MKNVGMLLLALFIVWIVWKLVKALIFTVLGPVISIAMILLFCFLVYTVYKALNRQKIM